MLSKFQHLESIPVDCRDWRVNATNARALPATLREQFERGLLFRKLATLRTDKPTSVCDYYPCMSIIGKIFLSGSIVFSPRREIIFIIFPANSIITILQLGHVSLCAYKMERL